MKMRFPIIMAMLCCVATGCFTRTVQKPLAKLPSGTRHSVAVPVTLPQSKISWWLQLRAPKELATPISKTRVRVQVTNLSPQAVQLFFLNRPGIILAPQQAATVYENTWESIPVLERLFGCQTMHHSADLRLDFGFDPELNLAGEIQLFAVKSDAL